MVIVVTGGAGYIGSHAARWLRKNGYDVILYDNLSTGHEVLASGFELVRGELADREKLGAVLARAEAVMHFAAHAYVGESVKHPRKYFTNNVEAALTLLNTCITEATPREPVNPYGVSKLFFENALEAYARAYGMRFVTLRYFNASGADEDGSTGELHHPETHLIPLALAAVEGSGPVLEIFGCDYPTPDGTCIRDYVHVSDLAEAHVLALQHLVKGGNSLALNLGMGKGYSVREVLLAVEEVTGKKVPWREAPRRPGDPPSLIADPSRAQSALGWKARRSLREIVASAWKWMQSKNLVLSEHS